MSRTVSRIDRQGTVFLLCDMQERFRGVIHQFPATLHVCSMLTRAASIFNIPLIATEQYPERLLHTVEELPLNTPNVLGNFSKTKFSMLVPEVEALFNQHKFTTAVLFGIEGHVCVQQTALELLSRGVDVHLVCDAVSSQRPYDREVALQRMQQAGARLTTGESVLMELLRDKANAEFKEISALLKEARPEAKY